MMLDKIIEYREQGLSFRKIAKQMNTTVGKVQYQWVKYQKSLEETKAAIAAASEEKVKPLKRSGRYKGRLIAKKRKPAALKTDLTVMFSEGARVMCYWNIPGSIIKQVGEFHGLSENQYQYSLRVFDITSIAFNGHNHHSYTDIIVPPQAAHWFISSLKPNRSYCVEYGIVDVRGRFTGITRSNVFHTPRTSHNQEVHQMDELQEYAAGKTKTPHWVEHVSTYSYYLKN
ncbi:DUF4912 domain-containing protein [Bacillus sp. AK031]